MQQQRHQQQNPQLVMMILWGALASAQLIFLFMGTSVLQLPPEGTTMADEIKYVFMAVAAGSFFMSFILPKVLGTAARQRLEKSGRSIQAMELKELLPAAMVPFILRCALLESVTLMGLMLTLQSGDKTYIMACAAVALVGFALSFPSERNVRGFVS